MPHVMDVPSPADAHCRYVTTRRNVRQNLEVGNDLRANLVATRLRHPLFELPIGARRRCIVFLRRRRIVPGQPANPPVVVHAEQEMPALQVDQRDQLLGQRAVVDDVALELDAGVLARGKQLE